MKNKMEMNIEKKQVKKSLAIFLALTLGLTQALPYSFAKTCPKLQQQEPTIELQATVPATFDSAQPIVANLGDIPSGSLVPQGPLSAIDSAQVEPFEVSVAMRADGNKNLSVSVDSDGHATVTWNRETYQGVWNATTMSIVLSIPSHDPSKTRTMTFSFAQDDNGGFILTKCEDISVTNSDSPLGRTTTSLIYEFDSNSLLSTDTRIYETQGYDSSNSTSYEYITVAGKTLVSFASSTGFSANHSAWLESRHEYSAKSYYEHDEQGNLIGSVYVATAVDNGKINYSASYDVMDLATKSTTRVDANGVDLMEMIGSWQDHTLLDQYAHTQTVSYFPNTTFDQTQMLYSIQKVRQEDESGNITFVARKVRMGREGQYIEHIVQGEPDVLGHDSADTPDILIQGQQRVNNYWVFYGEGTEYNSANFSTTYKGYGLIFLKDSIVDSVVQQSVVVVDYPTKTTVTLDGKNYNIRINDQGVVEVAQFIPAIEPADADIQDADIQKGHVTEDLPLAATGPFTPDPEDLIQEALVQLPIRPPSEGTGEPTSEEPSLIDDVVLDPVEPEIYEPATPPSKQTGELSAIDADAGMAGSIPYTGDLQESVLDEKPVLDEADDSSPEQVALIKTLADQLSKTEEEVQTMLESGDITISMNTLDDQTFASVDVANVPEVGKSRKILFDFRYGAPRILSIMDLNGTHIPLITGNEVIVTSDFSYQPGTGNLAEIYRRNTAGALISVIDLSTVPPQIRFPDSALASTDLTAGNLMSLLDQSSLKEQALSAADIMKQEVIESLTTMLGGVGIYLREQVMNGTITITVGADEDPLETLVVIKNADGTSRKITFSHQEEFLNTARLSARIEQVVDLDSDGNTLVIRDFFYNEFGVLDTVTRTAGGGTILISTLHPFQNKLVFPDGRGVTLEAKTLSSLLDQAWRVENN